MQTGFTSPDGYIGVNYPEKIVPRPRAPKHSGEQPFIALLPATEIKMAWLPHYTDATPRRRPVHPNWIGTMVGPLVYPAVAPISWMPTLLGFLAAPRVHRVFNAFNADPLSGDMMQVAQLMVWDPHPKVGVVVRPRLRAGGETLVIPPNAIAAGHDCVELVDVDYTYPQLTGQALTASTLIDEVFTVPDLVTEDLC